MPIPCPPKAPAYYTSTLHVVAVISAPINVFGLYLVLYKSPAISKYKYCIFYVQTAAFLTEIQMSLVAPGYYFFPILGGYNTNDLVARTLTDTHVLMTIYLFFLTNELSALVWCFVYRHSAAENINPNHLKSRIGKKVLVTASQMFPFAVTCLFYYSSIDREERFEYLLKNYPQCLYWLDLPGFALYDWNTNRMIAVTGLGALISVLIFSTFAFSLAFQTMHLLHKLRSHMSPQTYRMHQTALIALSLQVIIPSLLLLLPLFICFWVVAFGLQEHQELATNSTVLICFHSVSSTIVMIAANPRYRSIVGECFWSRTCGFLVRGQMIAAVEPSSNYNPRSVTSRNQL